jgi:pilus assembly protein Flp/PilA
MLKKLFKNRRGAALVEYALLLGGVALISAGAVSLFGHKTSDIVGMMAAILPGAHVNDNGPIQSGHLIETSNVGTSGAIAIDVATIVGESNQDRLGLNVIGGTAGSANGVDGLIVESR